MTKERILERLSYIRDAMESGNRFLAWELLNAIMDQIEYELENQLEK